MSQGNEGSLRFSLEESVWFQKGQEIEDLISVSLDPVITIEEYEQYVNIRGGLHLTGEYKRYASGQGEEEDFEPSPKFIQRIEDKEDGISEFSHRFPIDITIPVNRIQSINGIDVQVESFDYVLPERSCMKLTADLMITGLIEENGPYTIVADRKPEPEPEMDHPSLELVPDDLAKDKGNTDQKGFVGEHSLSAEELIPIEVEARKIPEQNDVVDLSPKEGPAKIEEIPIVEIQTPEEKEPDISFSGIRNEDKFQTESDSYYAGDVQEEADEWNNALESSVVDEIESSSSPEPVIKKKHKKQGISIKEFLARKGEEEKAARLKVCIVQSGETIEQLAERYEVTTQQILRVNQLELSQDIYEGQVLYIPQKTLQN